MKPVEILADVLDGSPLMYACSYLWKKDRAWCEEHCKWEEATKECWLRYAEMKSKEVNDDNH